MTRPPSVAAVVVHFGDPSVTAACLAALDRVRYPRLTVVVVDNGGDAAALRAAMSRGRRRLTILPRRGNTGFAAGANGGMRAALAAGARMVWLLNNDAIPAPGALAPLVRAAGSHPRVGMVGSLVLDDRRPARIWHAGGTINLATGLTVSRGAGARDAGRFHWTEPVAWVTGCSLLATAPLVRATGGIDERFVMYYEETDWCLRARARGWQVLFCPASRVVHRVAARAGRRDQGWLYWEARNRLLLLRRHAPGRVLPALGGMLRWPIGSTLLRGRPRAAWAAVRGILAFSRLALGRSR